MVKTVEYNKNLFKWNIGFFLIIPHVVKNYFRAFLDFFDVEINATWKTTFFVEQHKVVSLIFSDVGKKLVSYHFSLLIVEEKETSFEKQFFLIIVSKA